MQGKKAKNTSQPTGPDTYDRCQPSTWNWWLFEMFHTQHTEPGPDEDLKENERSNDLLNMG